MPFPPDLFLIGAQKAGTTYLANLLGQHPDVCLADPKEPDYFTRYWESGEDWYRQRFAQPQARCLLDASTSYSATPVEPPAPGAPPSRLDKVPERIAGLSPDARFIYLMRDPVKRAYSSYWHAVRGGHEQRPFAEVIRNDEFYLRMGCYHHQLQHYLAHFDRDRFQLLLFEDFIKAPEATANICLAFAGLTPLDEFRLDRGTNQTYAYGPLLRRMNTLLADRGGLRRVTATIKNWLPHSLLRRVRGALTSDIPPMDPADRDWLADYYAPHNARLAEAYGLDLSAWTTPMDSAGGGADAVARSNP